MTQHVTVTGKEVEHIASLARLQVSKKERDALSGNLDTILSSFSSIQDIDTKGVPTASDASGLSNVLREDVVDGEYICAPEDVLKRVPDVYDGQVRVQAVFNDKQI